MEIYRIQFSGGPDYKHVLDRWYPSPSEYTLVLAKDLENYIQRYNHIEQCIEEYNAFVDAVNIRNEHLRGLKLPIQTDWNTSESWVLIGIDRT